MGMEVHGRRRRGKHKRRWLSDDIRGKRLSGSVRTNYMEGDITIHRHHIKVGLR